MAKEALVYRYRGIDENLNAGAEPPTNREGHHRYATMAWISANRNVQVMAGSERTVDSSVLDMNGMCFLAD